MLNYISAFICFSIACADYSFVTEYAPRIYMADNESYFPSSVEYFENYTHVEKINGSVWVMSNERPSKPSAVLPYFHGQNVTKNPPVYAIVMPDMSEKDPVSAIIDPYNHRVVVTYFTLYPYNRGKVLFNTVWDNHVGDIEHVHVYFNRGVPTKVVASYHAWNTTKIWGDPDIQMVNGTNHFVLYCASGSHGLWFKNGTHVYHTDPTLSDYTSNGSMWDTWLNTKIITPYDWSLQRGYGMNWLLDILRWGDPHTDFPVDNCFFGYCRFEDGPVGMLGKSQIQETINSLKSRGYICPKGCDWNSGIF